VSKRNVDAAIKNWPHILGSSMQRLNNALDCFSEISVRKERLVPVITSSPQLLLRNSSDFFEVCNQLLLLKFWNCHHYNFSFLCHLIAFLLYEIYLFVNLVTCNQILKQTAT
jgi:mTERF